MADNLFRMVSLNVDSIFNMQQQVRDDLIYSPQLFRLSPGV